MTRDSEFASTSPTDPDTDGDGVWDGWIGVYDVGYSDNVVLYREHLHDDDGNGSPSGIRGDERVDEQTGVHRVKNMSSGNTAVPAATAVDIDDDGWTEHSNVHISERHWGTNPADDDDTPDRSLRIEVDYLEGYDPTVGEISGPGLGTLNVLEATRQNYALYGIDLTFEQDDELSASELEDICRPSPRPRQRGTENAENCVTPSSFNVWETDIIEDESHQDEDAMPLFYANRYDPDRTPQYLPHDLFIPSTVGGLEGHTGSPTQVAAIEDTGLNPHGTVVFAEASSGPRLSHKILMECNMPVLSKLATNGQ